jgi:glycosyltransferase involved in cell wall biosynthesis
VLGYTTASVFNPVLRKRGAVMVTNMDGLEWKRDKWSRPVKALIRSLEALGAKYGGHLVSDHPEIRRYLLDTYGQDSTCIAYGADTPHRPDPAHFETYGVTRGAFDLIIARLEKENHIEMILDGVAASKTHTPILVVGKYHTAYGRFLKEKYQAYPNIRFAGGIYSASVLDTLREGSRFYFHGHSVGGTNPSLLEAMAAGAFIAAHDNAFNKGVLEEHALYFSDSSDIVELLNKAPQKLSIRTEWTAALQKRIRTEYSWEHIANRYEELFLRLSATSHQ